LVYFEQSLLVIRVTFASDLILVSLPREDDAEANSSIATFIALVCHR